MLLIGNGRVITRDQENPYLEDGAVVISGEKIKEVGSLTEMKAKYPEAEFVDAKGGVIMPGLINAHTHIYSGLAYKEQTTHVSEGSEYLVALYIDKSGRLAATMRINKYLEKSETLVKDSAVTGTIIGITPDYSTA